MVRLIIIPFTMNKGGNAGYIAFVKNHAGHKISRASLKCTVIVNTEDLLGVFWWEAFTIVFGLDLREAWY